jgi:hypothetical protein
MISAINSYSSPVSVQVPQQINEQLDSTVGSSSAKKAGRIRTGVAECNDSFEQAKDYDFSKFYSKMGQKHYIPDPEKILEKQKIEHSKGYKPGQQEVELQPVMITPAPVMNASLAADLSANMLSMIRV